MRTEQFIADLASRVRPVRRIAPVTTRFVWWCAVAIASLAVGIGVLGVRPDLPEALNHYRFLVSVQLPAATAALAGLAALMLSVPGTVQAAALRGSASAIFLTWAAVSLVAVVAAVGGSSAAGWNVCFVRVLAIGAGPGLVLFVLVRRAMPLSRAWAAAMAALAGASVGSATIRFACGSDAAAHAVLGHFGPALVAAAAAALAAPLLLARRRR